MVVWETGGQWLLGIFLSCKGFGCCFQLLSWATSSCTAGHRAVRKRGPAAVPCAATQALGALGDGLRKKLPFKKKLFLFLLVAKVLSLRGGELPVPFWGFFWVDCFYIWNVKQV